MPLDSIGKLPGGLATARAAEQVGSTGDKDKLKKACSEMEGYFVGMLLKQMHHTSVKSGVFEERSESSTYREMFDDAVAGEIGKRGSFGIADMLYRELSKREEAASKETPAPAEKTTSVEKKP